MQGHRRGEPVRKHKLRLPVIAPKDDQPSSASAKSSLSLATANVSVPSRARLPPRSRTGCWTCRTRKVKCDEGRPTCGQCTRLGHACDYSPRLSFRDDTLRVVERMQDVSTLGSSIWDPACSTHTDGRKSAIADDLPPFATLTTDEDRERKAECALPGTYNVVVNPESFQHLPEYSEDFETRNDGLSPFRSGSLPTPLPNSQSLDGIRRTLAYKSDDPNVITLLRFEDTSRRSTLQWQDSCSPPTSEVSIARPSTDGVDGVDGADGVEGVDGNVVPDGVNSIDGVKGGDSETTVIPTTSLMFTASSGGQDWHLLQRFRNVVWRQLTQVLPEHSEYVSSGTDVVERAAAFFPPLFHAMMAVAALSLAHLEGKERLDALQHYQKALPALQSNLRSTEDLSSDGAFLTHYMLLVYEIAAAGSGGSNLWSQHLAQLLRISLSRREVFGGERFPFITWWICNIDLYALFSGAGSGEYVGTMLKNDMMPPPNFHLYPLGVDGSSLVYAEETETLPTVLQLNYEVTVLAVRLGLLAQELRQEASYTTDDGGSHARHLDTKLRQSRVLELQESLRHLWVAPRMIMLGQQLETLPRRSRQLFEHAWTLFQACMIYSHTSMWSSQRLDTGPDFESEIALCVAEILHTAEKIIKAGGLELRFIIFPLFMAGFASTDGGQKMMALDLITSMERESIGSNTTATRHALQIVYESQMQRFMHIGHSLDIHWTDIMVEQGLQVVNFGL